MTRPAPPPPPPPPLSTAQVTFDPTQVYNAIQVIARADGDSNRGGGSDPGCERRFQGLTTRRQVLLAAVTLLTMAA